MRAYGVRLFLLKGILLAFRLGELCKNSPGKEGRYRILLVPGFQEQLNHRFLQSLLRSPRLTKSFRIQSSTSDGVIWSTYSAAGIHKCLFSCSTVMATQLFSPCPLAAIPKTSCFLLFLCLKLRLVQ